MEKLPRIMNVQVQDQGRIAEKVIAMIPKWDATLRTTSTRENGKWSGPIDRPLSGMLRTIDSFCAWLKANRVTRRDEAMKTFARLERSPTQQAQALALRDAEDLNEWRRCFANVSHHSQPATDVDFHDQLSSLEDFLLDRLEPRPLQGLDAIDALLEEARRVE
jgi:hypothetical protein